MSLWFDVLEQVNSRWVETRRRIGRVCVCDNRSRRGESCALSGAWDDLRWRRMLHACACSVSNCVFTWRALVSPFSASFLIGLVRLYSWLEVLRLPWSSSIIVLYVLEVVCMIFTMCTHMSSPIIRKYDVAALIHLMRSRLLAPWSVTRQGKQVRTEYSGVFEYLLSRRLAL